MKLTRRQCEILAFIRQRLAADGLPPTRSEIVQHFGFRSPNAAQSHLKALAERGAIELKPGKARGIVPIADIEPSAQTKRMAGQALPIIGRVAAGSPLLAVENHLGSQWVEDGLFKPRPDYLLKVEGNSMTGAGILDGDLLLVHKTPAAEPGQIVVARLDGEVTVKRLRKAGARLFLDAENPAYPPIQVDPTGEFAIEGRAVGLIRPQMA